MIQAPIGLSPVLSVPDVRKHFTLHLRDGLALPVLLHGVSLDVYAGVCVALVGASGQGKSTLIAGAQDLGGNWLLPGLVEVHTDSLERHVMPRPKVYFLMQGAVQAHDAEVVSAGIITVLDATGDPYGKGFRARVQSELLSVLDRLEAAGVLRADHLIHVRCELPAPNARALFEPFAHHPRLRLISLMDHTPGQRQWTELAHATVYYTGKKGCSDARWNEEVRVAPQRRAEFAAPIGPGLPTSRASTRWRWPPTMTPPRPMSTRRSLWAR